MVETLSGVGTYIAPAIIMRIGYTSRLINQSVHHQYHRKTSVSTLYSGLVGQCQYAALWPRWAVSVRCTLASFGSVSTLYSGLVEQCQYAVLWPRWVHCMYTVSAGKWGGGEGRGVTLQHGTDNPIKERA